MYAKFENLPGLFACEWKCVNGFVSLGIEEWILVYNSEKVTVFWVASVIWLFGSIGFCHWILGLWELILKLECVYIYIYVYWPVEIYL